MMCSFGEVTGRLSARMGLALAAVAGSFACSPGPIGARAAALSGAARDEADPAVVAIPIGDALCTGTLVTDRVVLTAAHCVGSTTVVLFGTTPDDATPIRILEARVHPNFEDGRRDDLALLVLEEGAPAEPVPMPEAPLDGALVGREVRLVGFGLTSATATDDGRKRTGTARVSALGDLDFAIEPSPTGACFGDSGGPALVTTGDGLEVLVGVISEGDPGCAEGGRVMRVDHYLDDFIRPVLRGIEPASVGPGERCIEDATCAAGTCEEASDEPRLRFCSPECAGDLDCPRGMACEVGTSGPLCLWPTPSPGAVGAPCASNGDCLDRRSSLPEHGPAVCAEWCWIDDPRGCRQGFECRADGDDPFRYSCFAIPARGVGSVPRCAAAPEAGAPHALVVVLIALVLGRVRKGSRTVMPSSLHPSATGGVQSAAMNGPLVPDAGSTPRIVLIASVFPLVVPGASPVARSMLQAPARRETRMMKMSLVVLAALAPMGCTAAPEDGPKELDLAAVSERTGVELDLLENLVVATNLVGSDPAITTPLFEEILIQHAARRGLPVETVTGDYTIAVNDLYASLWSHDDLPAAFEILDRLGFYENGFVMSMWLSTEYSACTGCCNAFNYAKQPWAGTLACQCSGSCGGGGGGRPIMLRDL